MSLLLALGQVAWLRQWLWRGRTKESSCLNSTICLGAGVTRFRCRDINSVLVSITSVTWVQEATCARFMRDWEWPTILFSLN